MIFLNVPYSEKNTAKALGARWHGDHKRWYLPDGIDPTPFYRWLSLADKEKLEELSAQNPDTKGISLSSLLSKVHQTVANEFKHPIWLNCEIAALNTHRSGHLYLELIETDSNGREICKNKSIIWSKQVPAIVGKFKEKTGEDLKSGLKVLLLVEVEFNIAFGLSLKTIDIDPEFTLGGIEAKINEIRNTLKKKELYDQNKRYNKIEDFTNVAVISPSGAAGLGDFKAEADFLEYFNLCNFDYYEATFQGKSANKSISSLFRELEIEFKKDKYDAVVFIRGGGAKTDLHFLNEYDIAKAICECPLPVIVGIGHERDKVILDEVAFKSLDTPSKVAQFITQQIISKGKETIQNMEFIHTASKSQVNRHLYSIDKNITDIFRNAKEYTTNLSLSLERNIVSIKENSVKTAYKCQQENDRLLNSIFSYSKTRIAQEEKDTERAISEIMNSSKNYITLSLSNLEGLMKEIDAYNPKNVLEKGYALIKKDNKIIKNIETLSNNDIIEIQIGNKSKKFKITLEEDK